MIHAFMQKLCGYPPTNYLVTPTVYSTAADRGFLSYHRPWGVARPTI
jgi:hypothetical protein